MQPHLLRPAVATESRGIRGHGCGKGRSVADVSAIGDPETGVDMYDSTPEEPHAPTGWGVWGGTSVASPIVAAEYALAGGAHGVPYPAQTLYQHLGDAGALYDVTSGEDGTLRRRHILQSRGRLRRPDRRRQPARRFRVRHARGARGPGRRP